MNNNIQASALLDLILRQMTAESYLTNPNDIASLRRDLMLGNNNKGVSETSYTRMTPLIFAQFDSKYLETPFRNTIGVRSCNQAKLHQDSSDALCDL
jgi:hypothetical protein